MYLYILFLSIVTFEREREDIILHLVQYLYMYVQMYIHGKRRSSDIDIADNGPL